ncbi:transcriptional regulator [Amycolatopsis thailandensis]|uniref:Transcriptional regulator n=1 Tax=Amycolatopsis thailandensis TaxID=589330 RepID=A0A229S3L7_9PSEU|nr:helix-turn-helix domain-containing protein [Amycolatopsis thailandensis]OXM53351.1 transcriptional regulator [Amycolatopsis thailandensis]
MTGPPTPEEVTDPAVLKAMTHPLRRRIMESLGREPATATKLAKQLGESSGATSYHLRELARYDFIEEAPELAHGKERWWRARHRDIRWPRHSEQSEEMRAVFDEAHRAAFAEDLEQMARFLRRRDELGEWGDALVFSRGAVHVNLEELKQFWEEYLDLLRRYWRPEPGPDVRKVYVRWTAFPDPDEE